MKEMLIKTSILFAYIFSGILFGATFIPAMNESHNILALTLNPFLYIHFFSALAMIAVIIYYGPDASGI